MDQLLDMLAEAIAAKLAERMPAQTAPQSDSQWLDTKRAAEHLGVKSKTMEEWRSAGRGPRWSRVGARSIRYSRADLDLWMRRDA